MCLVYGCLIFIFLCFTCILPWFVDSKENVTIFAYRKQEPSFQRHNNLSKFCKNKLNLFINLWDQSHNIINLINLHIWTPNHCVQPQSLMQTGKWFINNMVQHTALWFLDGVGREVHLGVAGHLEAIHVAHNLIILVEEATLAGRVAPVLNTTWTIMDNHGQW